jgi:hypothetical protein
MKTKIIQKTYQICGIDEEGLIPKEAVSAIVTYNENEPKKISFILDLKKYKKDFEQKDNDTLAEFYWKERQIRKKYNEEKKRINCPRTKEEMTQIINRLESLLSENSFRLRFKR